MPFNKDSFKYFQDPGDYKKFGDFFLVLAKTSCTPTHFLSAEKSVVAHILSQIKNGKSVHGALFNNLIDIMEVSTTDIGLPIVNEVSLWWC